MFPLKVLTFVIATIGLNVFPVAIASDAPQPQGMNVSTSVETVDSADLPKVSYFGNPGFTVSYSPDFVGCDIQRRFAIELAMASANQKIVCSFDGKFAQMLANREFSTRFDRFGKLLPNKSTQLVRRYYFKSLHRSPCAKIKFTTEDGSSGADVPVILWDFNDLRQFRTIDGNKLPRRYPEHGYLPYSKSSQTIPAVPRTGGKRSMFSPSHWTHNTERFDIHDFTAEEFWRTCPDTGSFGRYNGEIGYPDPYSGTEVFKQYGAHIPYILAMPKPGNVDDYSVKNAETGKIFPTNKIGEGDYTTGDYIDDGIFGLEYGDLRNHFAGMTANWRGMHAFSMIHHSADNFLATSDIHDLHLTLVGLARHAVEFTYLSAMPQSRRANFLNGQTLRLTEALPVSKAGNAGFTANGISTTAHIHNLTVAYDKIFPYMERDPDIIPFLRNKGLPVNSIEELKKFIEEGIFMNYIQIVLDRQCNLNWPGNEKVFMGIVATLDYPDSELFDIAYHGTGTPSLWQTGFLRQLIGTAFFRDGFKFENPGGYNGNANLEALELLDDNIALIRSRHPDIYTTAKYPLANIGKRLVTAAETHIEHALLPTTRLRLGDAGGFPVFNSPNGISSDKDAQRVEVRKPNFFGDETARFFERVFKQNPTSAKVAWALVNTEGWNPPDDFGYPRSALESLARTFPSDWRARGRILSGQGISILRSGAGADERCLVTHAGNPIGHAGQTNMGFYLDAFGTKLITHWGYPVSWHKWYSSWFTNNSGRPFPAIKDWDLQSLGSIDLNVDVANIHVSETRECMVKNQTNSLNGLKPPAGSVFTDMPEASSQRRLFAMVDLDEKDFYIVELYRMLGGTNHWRTFGTLDGPCQVNGLDLSAPKAGTLAGENVMFNQNGIFPDADEIGFKILHNVQTATTGNSPWTADWSINNSNGLKVRLTGVSSDGAQLNLCDAKEPLGAHSIVRKMLAWHHPVNGSNPRKSHVLNLIEAFRDTPVIVSSQLMPVQGEPGEATPPIGFCVTLKNGRSDYFILSDDRNTTKTMVLPNGKKIQLVGRMACVALNADASVNNMSMIEGTRLSYDKRTLTHPAAMLSATINGVDPVNWSFTIPKPKFKLPDLNEKNFSVLRNGNGQKLSLEIRGIKESGKNLIITTNATPVVNTFTIKMARDSRWLLFSDMPGSGRRAGISPGKYTNGSSVRGVNGQYYRIDTITENGIRLVHPLGSNEELSAAFPRDTEVTVLDYAPGDVIEIPFAHSLK